MRKETEKAVIDAAAGIAMLVAAFLAFAFMTPGQLSVESDAAAAVAAEAAR